MQKITRKIFIDSSQRDYGQSNNFNIQLRESIHNVKGIRLCTLFLPNSIYNVSPVFGNTIALTDVGGLDTLSIPSGNYSITQLLTQIQTQANASGVLGETYTLSYSNITGLCTFSATGNFTIITTPLSSKLGFPVTTTNTTPHIGTSITDLRPTKSVFVSLLNLPMQSNFNAIVNSCIGSVSTNDIFLSTLESDIDYEMIELQNKVTISNLDVQLIGDNGSIIDNLGVNWCMTLEVEIEP